MSTLGTTAQESTWEGFFGRMALRGLRPAHVLDVGANRGHWTRTALKFFPDAAYTLVEPQQQLRSCVEDLLQDGKVTWINAGVSERPGRLALTVAPEDTSSSFLPDAALAERLGFRQVEVDVRTINELVASSPWGIPDVVKIDAEGYDLKALAGASELYGKTELFFVEAAVCAPLIENTMAAVIRRMDEIGYRMVDITDLNRSPRHGVLWLCELAFLRKSSPLLDGLSNYA